MVQYCVDNDLVFNAAETKYITIGLGILFNLDFRTLF